MSPLIKKRWILEAITWKASSTLLGALIILALTGRWKLSLIYMLIYVPVSTLWYLVHKKLWSLWKHRKEPAM
jgi:uncharacterized membrane protein